MAFLKFFELLLLMLTPIPLWLKKPIEPFIKPKKQEKTGFAVFE